MTAEPLPLVSYTLRFLDNHVRARPARALDGTPFRGAGVDLRGVEAAAAISAAKPVVAWLDAREPGVDVRSISVRTERPRILVSLAPAGDDPRPRAMRFEPPSANELRDAARAVEEVIGRACAVALARRASG